LTTDLVFKLKEKIVIIELYDSVKKITSMMRNLLIGKKNRRKISCLLRSNWLLRDTTLQKLV